MTAAAVSCSIQCLYMTSASDILVRQVLAELLRVPEDGEIVKVQDLQQQSLWCTARASVATVAVIRIP